MTYLDSRLDALHLNRFRLPDTVFLHVHQSTRVTIKTPVHVALNMLSPHASQNTDWTGTGILSQCPWDNLHRISHGLVRPLLNTLNRLGQVAQLDGDCHLQSTTTRGQAGVEDNVPGHGHGILQVTLDLVQDVLGGTAQKDSACLGGVAFPHESKVFITYLLDFEETTLRTNVRFLDVFHTVDNRCTSGSGNTVVVRFPHTAEGCDVGLGHKVLGKV